MHAHLTVRLAIVALLAGMTVAALPTGTASAVDSQAVTLTGLDMHDGSVSQVGSVLYAYGTRYGCGFSWGKTSPWCGFGISESASISGPWTTPKLLFSTGTVIKATGWTGDNGRTWSAMCGNGGAGCFNPRMIHAPNGTYLLWFNAPGDKARHANPYWVMTCSGPMGPCGSPHKPSIYGCNTGGDFSLAVQGATGYLVCSATNRIITVEKLAAGDANGLNSYTGHISNGPAEGVGIYHTSKGYVAVYSNPQCGYCSGPPDNMAAASGATEVQAGYSTAPNLAGPWTYQGVMSAGYCTGQPRTAFSADGQAWEWVDEWTGAKNETSASILLVPFAESPWSCAA